MATYTPSGGGALNFGLLIDPPNRRTEQQVSERLIFGTNNSVVDVIGKSVTKIIGRARIDSYASLATFEGAVGTEGTLVYSEEPAGITVLFRMLNRVTVTPNDIHICDVEFWIIGSSVTLRFISLDVVNQSTATTLTSVLGVTGEWGTDKQYSECHIVFPSVPAAGYNDEIRFTGGIVGGNVSLRFTGVVRDFQYDPGPGTVTLICYGWLRLAVEYENWENPDFVGGLIPLDLTGSSPDTAPNIINAALAKTPIPSAYIGSIGGTGTLYGTFFDAFIWRNGFNPDNPFLEEAGESCYSYISRFDEVDADTTSGRYRIIDTVGVPPIQRVTIGRPGTVADFTFTEGIDILAGSFTRESESTRNYFVVTGYDIGDGTGPIFDQTQESNPIQGTQKFTKQLSSPMIENSTLLQAAGQTVGMVCADVCQALGVEFNREFVRGWIETFRDDLIGIAQTHLVQGGVGGTVGQLGLAERVLVQGVTITVDDRGWTQRMEYVGGGV